MTDFLLFPPSASPTIEGVVKCVLIFGIAPAVLGIAVAICARAYNIYSHTQRGYPPKPPGYFLMGTLPMLRARNLLLVEGHVFRQYLHAAYGKVVSVYAPFTVFFSSLFAGELKDLMIVNVAEPVVVQALLSDKENIYQQRFPPASLPSLPKHFRDGMLGLPMGDEWTKHRKLLSALFSENSLKVYADVVNERAHLLVQHWKNHGELGAPRNISDEIMGTSLDIIAAIGFGKNLNTMQDPSSPFLKAGHQLSEHTYRSILLPAVVRKIDYKRERECLKGETFFDRLADEMVEEYYRKREITSAATNATAANSEGKESNSERTNFLRTLLDCRNENAEHLSIQAIKAEAITMLMAGHETTANTVIWALHHLAKYPEAQKKLHEEIDRVVPSMDSPVLYEQVAQLRYMKACFYETLRMMPAVPQFLRSVKATVTYGKYTLPRGTILGINTYAMGRDPDHWDEPDVFNPERFIERTPEGDIETIKSPETAGRKSFAFLPFGSGPRSCIGKRLAINKGMALLAVILKNFRLEDCPSHIPRSSSTVTLTSLNGVYVKLISREV